MTKNSMWGWSLLFVVSATAQFFYLGHFKLTVDVLTNIVTLMSIFFGFYITSLAIFVTSKYVASLYQITDANHQSLTLLQTLVQNYKTGLQLILLSIIYALILLIVATNRVGESLVLSEWFVLLFVPLLVLDLGYSYIMLADLIKIIIQEAKHR